MNNECCGAKNSVSESPAPDPSDAVKDLANAVAGRTMVNTSRLTALAMEYCEKIVAAVVDKFVAEIKVASSIADLRERLGLHEVRLGLPKK